MKRLLAIAILTTVGVFAGTSIGTIAAMPFFSPEDGKDTGFKYTGRLACGLTGAVVGGMGGLAIVDAAMRGRKR